MACRASPATATSRASSRVAFRSAWSASTCRFRCRWHGNRADGVLAIAAHYVIRTNDGALIEVQSDGMRHGPPEVMARLARGDSVARDEYFFRTLMRFQTGAPAWVHLNKVMAIAVGQ